MGQWDRGPVSNTPVGAGNGRVQGGIVVVGVRDSFGCLRIVCLVCVSLCVCVFAKAVLLSGG